MKKPNITYTYYLGWTRQNLHYYGGRFSKHSHPDDFWKTYFTSSKYVIAACWLYGEPDRKEVRRTFIGMDKKNKCAIWEHKVLRRVDGAKSPIWLNKTNGSNNFNVAGMVTVKDKDGNTQQVSMTDPRYLSGELVAVNTGMVTVKDKDGNKFRVSSSDDRYLSGELVGVQKFMTPVKDKNGNTMSVYLDDPRLLSGELMAVSKGKISVKDKDGNTLQVSVTDPRYLSGELKNVSVGLIPVVDKNGNRLTVTADDSRYISGELVHTTKGFIVAKDKDGNILQIRKDDPRYISGELVGINSGKKWYNNGHKSSQYLPNQQPEGWTLGRLKLKTV